MGATAAIGATVPRQSDPSEFAIVSSLMTRVVSLQLCVWTILNLSVAARAQFTTIINVPPDAPVSHIGSNTHLNLFPGGMLPENFEAGVSNVTNTNLEMNIFGGTVGSNLTTHKGTAVN